MNDQFTNDGFAGDSAGDDCREHHAKDEEKEIVARVESAEADAQSQNDEKLPGSGDTQLAWCPKAGSRSWLRRAYPCVVMGARRSHSAPFNLAATNRRRSVGRY